MSGDHHRNEPTHPPSSKRTRKDESNGERGVVVVSSSSSSFPSFNSLPMDVLILIFEYIPQYPRLRVVKFVSKRFHSAVLRSFKTISSQDFNWNWKFVLPRFPSITSLDISHVNPSNLPDVLPPRIPSLIIKHYVDICTCSLIEKCSSLTSLSVSLADKCPPLDRLVSNSLSSLTFLEVCGEVTPPSTLYLPSLRHLALTLHLFAQPMKSVIMNHASQLTRLECKDVSYIQDIRFPLLRHLDVKLRNNDNTSFLQHCPSLIHFNATLECNGFDVTPVTHLLPLATCWRSAFEPNLHLATRLTAIDLPVTVDETVVQRLLPVASRLKKLSLRSPKKKKHDCAAILALCPMLEELKLSNTHIDSNASLSLPHLVKLEFGLDEYSGRDRFQCLNKLLVVAPRLRYVLVFLGKVETAHIVSFLQAAEQAGVERVELKLRLANDTNVCRKLVRSLKLQWLDVTMW